MSDYNLSDIRAATAGNDRGGMFGGDNDFLLIIVLFFFMLFSSFRGILNKPVINRWNSDSRWE